MVYRRLKRHRSISTRLLGAPAPEWSRGVAEEKVDRDQKLPYYAEQGVRHVWLLDPIDKRLEVYALDARSRRWREVRIHQGDTLVRAAPFDAIELDLAALWSPPRVT